MPKPERPSPPAIVQPGGVYSLQFRDLFLYESPHPEISGYQETQEPVEDEDTGNFYYVDPSNPSNREWHAEGMQPQGWTKVTQTVERPLYRQVTLGFGPVLVHEKDPNNTEIPEDEPGYYGIPEFAADVIREFAAADPAFNAKLTAFESAGKAFMDDLYTYLTAT